MIALVITIIVLLILAGISILAIVGDSGVVTKAKNAAEKTKLAQIEEILNLWKAEKEADKIIGENTAKNLDEVLKELENKNLINAEEKLQIENTGVLVIGGEIILFKNLEEIVEIGDYVNYIPEVPSDEEITQLENDINTYSGYSSTQEVSQEDLKWRIFNINDNGTVDLISASTTKVTPLYLNGYLGYNNRSIFIK